VQKASFLTTSHPYWPKNRQHFSCAKSLSPTLEDILRNITLFALQTYAQAAVSSRQKEREQAYVH